MASLTPHERAIIARIDPAMMLRQVESWATINSGSRNLPGLASTAHQLAQAYAALPGTVALVDPAPVSAVDSDGRTVALTHGQHLVVRVRPDAAHRALLTGHMDTVFAADHPFQALRWLDGTTLNGPGVADMKGGIAVMLAALVALEATDALPTLGYDILINSDEEVGSLSSAALIRELAAGKRAALTYEPSALPDGTLAGARAGSGNFSIVVRGRGAHAGRNPDDGRNALVAAADFALRLKAAHAPDLSINPAKIDGGGPNNVVPDLAILRVNLRPHSSAAQQRAQHLLNDLAYAIALDHQVTVEVSGEFARPPKPLDAGALALFGMVEDAGRALGLTIGRKDTGGVCDGNNIAACGVPVVDTMGVRGGNIHSDAEYLLTDSLGERAALSALTLLRIADQPGALIST
jgi:glutamate carboxypeptidase